MRDNAEKKEFKIYQPEEFVQLITKKICKRDKNTFLLSFFIGFLAYLPLVTSWLANPDAVWNGLHYKESYQWETSLGRFGLGAFAKIKNNLISPAVVTIVCLIFLALIVTIVRKIFEINEGVFIFLVTIFIILNPTIISTLTYYYCSDAYILSYLLVVCATYMLTKRSGFVDGLIGTICITLSLSLYQAYLPIALTLFLFFIIQQVLQHSVEIKCIIMLIIRFVIAVGMGVFLYLVSLKFIQWISQSSANGDRGFDRIGEFNVIRIIELIKATYSHFTNYFFTNVFLNNQWASRGSWNYIYTACILLLLILLIVERRIYKSGVSLLLVAICVMSIPVFLSGITIMAPDVSIYASTGIIMLPTMNYLYVLLLILAELLNRKHGSSIMKWIATGLGISITLISVSFIMASISYLQINERKMYSVATNIVNEIGEVSNYSEKLPILIGGRLEEGNLGLSYQELKIHDILKGTTASYGSVWYGIDAAQSCWINYFSQYCGINYNQCSNEVSRLLVETDEYKDMPCWPDQNSIKIIEDTVVIKLSN